MQSSQTKLIALVGEAWGEEEERTRIPFFGKAGQELNRMLAEAGIDRGACIVTNVLNLRPPNNDLKSLCLKRADALDAFIRERPKLVEAAPDFSWPATYSWLPIAGPGAFLHPRYLSELVRLRSELKSSSIGLVVALGNTACWGLLNRTGIGKLRGYIYPSTLVDGLRVLPTYHPAAILRQFSNRSVVIADFQKSQRTLAGLVSAAPAPSSRTVWIAPEESDLERWWSTFASDPGRSISVDIETSKGGITAIAFGVRDSAISIPFAAGPDGGGNYWPDSESERRVLQTVARWLVSPNPKLFQNALYDLQWIWKKWGARVNNVTDDTMLMHHALQPEMAKDLGFLGAAYTDEVAWKAMRKQAHMKAKAEKKDD